MGLMNEISKYSIKGGIKVDILGRKKCLKHEFIATGEWQHVFHKTRGTRYAENGWKRKKYMCSRCYKVKWAFRRDKQYVIAVYKDNKYLGCLRSNDFDWSVKNSKFLHFERADKFDSKDVCGYFVSQLNNNGFDAKIKRYLEVHKIK